MTTKENVSFKFNPAFEISEGHDKAGKWLKIGGLALEEGISKNNNKYTVKNLQENDGRDFKWLFGHPSEGAIEEHIVGKGKLSFSGKQLFHEGVIRNTSRHPDVMEAVKDGFLGPSIHATASKVTREEGVFLVEGLEIEGVGLVAFQGVKSASIDYAIAESFDKLESSEAEDGNKKNSEGEIKMSEEAKPEPEQEQPQPAEEQPKEPEAPAQPAESISVEEIKALREELAAIKLARKTDLVESVLRINKDLKKDVLMKESEDKLKLIVEYETKLAKPSESAAVVETAEEAPSTFVKEDDGSYSMSKEMYEKFNAELRQKVR
ncbi:hypothetical protein CMI37_31075 [Candidatus Pacearchaeota archaeon]|jgi:hypothetical protein|nr:hypothetical protein [Candidatus Pacearchaeota archaeon]|tara:strand:+ start:4063 stop:5025 length:963 start_codon:yes stop_codon:yes gene_type:complete